MFTIDIFTNLLIFQFILPSDAVIHDFHSLHEYMSSIKTASAHSVANESQHHKSQLIQSIESTNDETTLCLICQALGCVKSDTNRFDKSHHQNQNDEQQGQARQQQQQQADEQHPQVIVNIASNGPINTNTSHGDDDNDNDCLIGCGNNQTLLKCTALYHKKCLSKWISKSNKDVCLICNRKLSPNLLSQCTNHQHKRNVHYTRRSTQVRTVHSDCTLSLCCHYIETIGALVFGLVMIGVFIYGFYVLIDQFV